MTAPAVGARACVSEERAGAQPPGGRGEGGCAGLRCGEREGISASVASESWWSTCLDHHGSGVGALALRAWSADLCESSWLPRGCDAIGAG
jgi:hypothetical protein